MASPKRTTETRDPVVARLEDGHYDRLLEQFEAQLQEAAAALRRAYEAMREENTPRS